jgi:hypothetical protein
MSRSKKSNKSLTDLFIKPKPKPTHKVRKGLIGLGVVGAILAAFSKKTQP